MSRVFLAHDTELNRRIVLKVLPPELAGAVSEDRFRREIQVAARLQHPHIVPVLSAARAGEMLYYSMPFVEGESVKARIARSGALGLSECVSILRDVVRALAYAHRQGIVHRDIKPDNILLSEGSAMVADFGIAKAVSDAIVAGEGLTAVGVSVGTPAYMAPEQGVGDPSVDHRADIYAVGAVAYEMLTGEQVFGDRTPQQMMRAHVVETPPPLTSKVPDVPAALASLVMRCLEKDALKRPQNADELLQSLEGALTPALGTISTRAQPRSRRWARVGTIAVVAILVAAGGGLAFAPRDRLAMAMALMRRQPPTLHPDRIIVTPFENQTGDQKLDPLGAMAADWLAQGLSAIGGLQVVDARTTMVTEEVVRRIPWPFKSRDRAKALAEETGAGLVLSGRIYRDSDSLRIQANVTSASSGKLVRALSPVSGPISSPTKILDLLNRRVVASVAQVMDTSVTDVTRYSEPPSVEAYEETRRGMEAYFRQENTVFDHFERAIALDSTYATPLVLLAFSRLYDRQYEAADTAVSRAARLRDRMAPADRAMLLHVEAELRGDADASLATSQEFMRVTPGSSESPLLVASTALAVGRPRLALEVLKSVDPNRGMNLGGAFYWFYKAGALNALKQHKQALDVANQGLRRFPANAILNTIKGEALIGLGRHDQLDDLIRNAPAGRSPKPVAQARRARHFASVYLTLGDRARATRIASTWLPRILSFADTSASATMSRISLLLTLGRWKDASPLVRNAIAQHPHDKYAQMEMRSIAGVIAARMADTAEAKKIEAEIGAARGKFDNGFSKWMRARIAAHLGERDRA
ncbi:MAG TPA: protein kinase, partial [Thermoanaerobaculia bacterium]|nr:protein kinase [Thermoanaerobaculia bacterium]